MTIWTGPSRRLEKIASAVLGDSTLGIQRNRIAELSIAHRLPTSGTHRGWAEGGLLMSYGTDFVAQRLQARVAGFEPPRHVLQARAHNPTS